MDKYQDLVKRGYWVGGVSASSNLCTCKGITHDDLGEVHSKFCPKWKAEWVRRADAEKNKYGYVAVTDKTAY